MHRVDELYGAMSANNTGRIQELLAIQPDLANSVDETPPPIHWAIFQDKRQIVELLLDCGADIELRDGDRDATPLDYAIVYARKEIIPVLVSRGANTEGRLQTAFKGASGGFEEFCELPTRQEYGSIVQLLGELGVA